VKTVFFAFAVRITGKLLKIDGYMLQGVLQALKCHNSPTNGPTETNLGGHIPSYPRRGRHDSVAMATAVA